MYIVITHNTPFVNGGVNLKKYYIAILILTISINLTSCSTDTLKTTVEENNISGQYIEGVLCHDVEEDETTTEDEKGVTQENE